MRLKWFLLTVLLIAALVHIAPCKPRFKFYAPETTHTVVLPFERSFIFTVRFHNLGDEDLFVEPIMPKVEFPEDWLVILPSGRVLLRPGEEVDVVTTFEPANIAERKHGELSFNFTFMVQGKLYSIPIHVKYVVLDWEELPKEKVRVKVLDARTGKPVSDVFVMFTSPSGLMG